MFKKEIKKLLAVPMVCIMIFAITEPSFATEKNDVSDTAIDGGEDADIDGIEILDKSTYEDDSEAIVSTEIAIDFDDFDSVEEFQAALRESLGDYDTNEPETSIDTEPVLPDDAESMPEAARETGALNNKSAIKNINTILDLVLFNCYNSPMF